jgi:RND family efflux transporter MFP subunit
MYRNGRPGFGLVALALLGLSGCGNQDQPPAPPRTVETILAVSTSDLADAVYPGQVVSRFAIDYGFRVGGMLVARPVEVGQYVEAGTVLARLDPSDAEINLRGATAQAQAAAAQSQAETADLERSRRLVAEGFMSQAEFDRLQAGADAARGQLRASRAQQAGVSQQLTYTVLRARRSGVVTAVSAEAGEVVGAGQPIISIAEPGALEVAVSIPEGEVGRFRASTLGVRLWARPDQTYPGSLRTLSGAANPQTRTFDARVAFGGTGPDAVLGATAEVSVQTPAADDSGIVLPTTAVIERAGQPTVWVVAGSPSRVTARGVTIGAVRDDTIIVTGGLRAGERVVTAGGHLLKPNEQVRPTPSTASTNR